MEIATRTVGQATVVDATGPLKLGQAAETFRAAIEQLLEAGSKTLAINLASVPELDSTGIGELLRTHAAAKTAGGKCVFFSLCDRVRRTLEMVRMEKILALADDEASALAAF